MAHDLSGIDYALAVVLYPNKCLRDLFEARKGNTYNIQIKHVDPSIEGDVLEAIMTDYEPKHLLSIESKQPNVFILKDTTSGFEIRLPAGELNRLVPVGP